MAAVVALTLVVFAPVACGIYLIDRRGCEQVGTETGHPTAYRFPAGCFVRIGDKGDEWMPYAKWRGTIEVTDGQ